MIKSEAFDVVHQCEGDIGSSMIQLVKHSDHSLVVSMIVGNWKHGKSYPHTVLGER